ncbi:MAG: FadR family transcriptional regulator [Bifidobacteriaceae bacterium]|jgi:DNA-binding FadR family transcriptional regulator|nr:FadR family transcriptional regulator [Bifidobacteriaceae bacterium]
MPGKVPPERRLGKIDQVAEDMREQIVSGAWPVGARIPTEPELAAAAGTGRNTIREAVQSLVHAGLLERRQGSGTYVVSTSELPTVMERQFACASQRDVLEVRQALEIVAASLAARRRTPEQVERLRALLAARTQAVAGGCLDEMVATDMRLHRFIAKIAANPVLAELYATVLGAVAENIRHNFQRMGAQGDAHLNLVEAIARGDSGGAAREIERYLHEMGAWLP